MLCRYNLCEKKLSHEMQESQSKINKFQSELEAEREKVKTLENAQKQPEVVRKRSFEADFVV